MKSSNSDEEQKIEIKSSPCSRYERLNKTVDNLIGIGNVYLGMDSEEGTEVSWMEVKIFENDLLILRHHFDTIIRFTHPNLLKCHTYWIEEDNDEIILYFICELFSSSLMHFIKRTKLNNKSIPNKTQTRITKQILFGLSYLKHHNPPYFLPDISPKNVFMTHDGTAKLSTITPTRQINAILTGKCESDQEDILGIYKSLCNVARIVYSMATLELLPPELPQLIKQCFDNDAVTIDHKDFIFMLATNKNIRIPDLFRTKFMYVFPTLKLLAVSAIVKAKIDLSMCVLDFPADKVFLTFYPQNKEIRFGDVPPVDIKKFVIEIRQGLHPLVNVPSTDLLRRSGEISQSISPSASRRQCSHDPCDSPFCKKYEEDNNIYQIPSLLLAVQCRLDSPIVGTEQHRLKLTFLYATGECRCLETDILDITSTEHLVDDLLDKKLVNEKIKNQLLDLIMRVINGENMSLIIDTF